MRLRNSRNLPRKLNPLLDFSPILAGWSVEDGSMTMVGVNKNSFLDFSVCVLVWTTNNIQLICCFSFFFSFTLLVVLIGKKIRFLYYLGAREDSLWSLRLSMQCRFEDVASLRCLVQLGREGGYEVVTHAATSILSE